MTALPQVSGEFMSMVFRCNAAYMR